MFIYIQFFLLPDKTGWKLSMIMQNASSGVSFLTRVSTSVSFEKSDGYSLRVMIRKSDKTRPIKNEVETATTSENFAVLGWAAPSSFDTLTLEKQYNSKKFKYIYIYM